MTSPNALMARLDRRVQRDTLVWRATKVVFVAMALVIVGILVTA